MGAGGGLFAGMYSIGLDTTFRLPRLKDAYLKVGLAFADSKNVYPPEEWGKNWRNYIPLCIDGIYYFYDNIYVGAGLNYSLRISDDEIPAMGWEAYFGAEVKLGRGKVFIEAGCAELKRQNKPSFIGGQVIIGHRYDFATITVVERKKTD